MWSLGTASCAVVGNSIALRKCTLGQRSGVRRYAQTDEGFHRRAVHAMPFTSFFLSRHNEMTEFFREVEEDVRRDRIIRLWTKYRYLLFAVAVLVVAGTGALRALSTITATRRRKQPVQSLKPPRNWRATANPPRPRTLSMI